MNDALVSGGHRRWGRWATRPSTVNPLDAYTGLTCTWQRLRLKEWIGWTLMHPALSSSLIIQDAHYLASSEIYLRDNATGALTQHARNARGGSPALPASLYDSSPSLHAPGYAIDYAFGPEGGEHRIRVDIAAKQTKTGQEAALSYDLRLDGSRATAPLSVSSPLPGGAMYTHKTVFPISGTIRAGERDYEVDPARDLIILDEHKTFLPYRTTWTWGTFATQRRDGILGANLCERPVLTGTEDESCLWAGGTVRGLDRVAFTATGHSPLAPYRVRSHDGRVDLVFTPEGRKDVAHQLVVFAIDYWQLYGTYAGRLGETEISGIRGVLESMKARL